MRSICFFLAMWFASSVLVQADEPAIDRGMLLAPKVFRAATAKVLPAVVTIETYGGVAATGSGGRGISKPGAGPTTGLVLTADGHIITSTYNFIGRPPVITVILGDGSRHVAKLLGRDESRKICLLKIEDAKDLPLPVLAPRKELQVGQWAISVGVGYGERAPAISAGIVSALGRISGRAVQTDANISPANYGGPLIDVEGRVIGICVPLHPKSKEASSGVEWYDSGIGFAIPLAGADNLLASLKAGKSIEPARLGVRVERREGDDGGVVVTGVLDDSAAAKAGVKEGDRILTFEGVAIRDVQNLQTLVGARFPGDEVMLTLSRDGKRHELKVKLAAAD